LPDETFLSREPEKWSDTDPALTQEESLADAGGASIMTKGLTKFQKRWGGGGMKKKAYSQTLLVNPYEERGGAEENVDYFSKLESADKKARWGTSIHLGGGPALDFARWGLG